MKLLIAGFNQPGHMGWYLARAAKQLRLKYEIVDAIHATGSNRILQSVYWRICQKRQPYTNRFARHVQDVCAASIPHVVLTTGCAPLYRRHIEKLRALDCRVINYSTDDPWNPALKTPWFLDALPAYDVVYTTRRANHDDFIRCGVRRIQYLPFGYDPEIHRPWSGSQLKLNTDVLFIGGCDDDRLPVIEALIEAGLKVQLFGGYWDRHSKTRPYWGGIAQQEQIRLASASTRICLCLVRHANRDGHVMRSFEAAAIGGCILAEDTADHRELFGPDDYAARYFKGTDDLVTQARCLISDSTLRSRLSIGLRERMSNGTHTYADRLTAMLTMTLADESSQRMRQSNPNFVD